MGAGRKGEREGNTEIADGRTQRSQREEKRKRKRDSSHEKRAVQNRTSLRRLRSE